LGANAVHIGGGLDAGWSWHGGVQCMKLVGFRLTGVCFWSLFAGLAPLTLTHIHPQVGAGPLVGAGQHFFQRKGPTAQLGLIGGRPNAAEAARLGAGPEMIEFSFTDNDIFSHGHYPNGLQEWTCI